MWKRESHQLLAAKCQREETVSLLKIFCGWELQHVINGFFCIDIKKVLWHNKGMSETTKWWCKTH